MAHVGQWWLIDSKMMFRTGKFLSRVVDGGYKWLILLNDGS